jgi:hypothetical protein
MYAYSIQNSPSAYQFQTENGLPIKTWIDDTTDTELQQMTKLLTSLSKVNDVRPYIVKIVDNAMINYKTVDSLFSSNSNILENKKPIKYSTPEQPLHKNRYLDSEKDNHPIIDSCYSAKYIPKNSSIGEMAKIKSNSIDQLLFKDALNSHSPTHNNVENKANNIYPKPHYINTSRIQSAIDSSNVITSPTKRPFTEISDSKNIKAIEKKSEHKQNNWLDSYSSIKNDLASCLNSIKQLAI